MIAEDLIKVLVSLALIAMCAWVAIASASPPKSERAPRRERRAHRVRERRRARSATPVSAASGGASAAPISETAVSATGARPRPRILTGEPADIEPRGPVTRRAIKLVAGIAVLATGGAVGLLVLVRALVAIFKRINGS